MAPDFIYELAVLEVSRWQRQAWERKMSLNCYCNGHDNYYECPVLYFDKPSYPVPARIIEWDFWPAEESWNGISTLYGFDHYKPGRWKEFLAVNGEEM